MRFGGGFEMIQQKADLRRPQNERHSCSPFVRSASRLVPEYRDNMRSRRLRFAVAVAVVACAVPATASAAKVPAWYWTPAKAAANFARANPQGLSLRGHQTTVQKAQCSGAGTAKARAGVRVFREFACLVTFHDDELDTGGFAVRVSFVTSKTEPRAVACWAWSHAGLVKKGCV